MSASRSQVEAVIAPVVATAGYDLESLTVSNAGRRRLVKVVIDRDGGVTLDDAADLSRRISAVLDEDDALMGQGAFVLEVTSPGVDRPLTLERHWRRAQGRLVRLETTQGAGIVGRVLEADATTVTLDVDGRVRTMTYPSITKAIVQVELNRKEPTPADESIDEDSGPASSPADD
jgi:ribosome maturation factor RimP